VKIRKVVSALPRHFFLSFLMFVAISPLIILIFNSLKSRANLGADPVGYPDKLIFGNYANAVEQSNFLNSMTNSFILATFTVIPVLVLGGLAAYSLSRIQPRGTGAVMAYMLGVSTLPLWLYIVPLFYYWKTLGLINSFLGLVILYTAFNSPFAIFLLRSFLLKVPKEVEEAAVIDGANRMQILIRVILPLTWTGFLTVGLLVAVAVWGEFQVALIFISDPEKFPVTTAFFAFQQQFGNDWTLTSAVAVLTILPVLALFLSFQRKFTEGLTQGSVKA
jgi:raffinose/stachyose/melibiose transport system permease protein